MKGIIYKANNKKTGESYVGSTSKSIKERKKDHKQKANKGIGGYFQEAIGTYGSEAFIWEQLDTASNANELAQKEKEYIIKYDSKESGYNSDNGGGIKKNVYQYNIEDGLLIEEYDSLESAANAINVGKTAISNTCLGHNRTCKGFYWSYILTEPFVIETDLRKKKVIQFDLEGNKLAIFSSVAEASRQTGVSKTCISRVCRGERNCAGGFRWSYK